MSCQTAIGCVALMSLALGAQAASDHPILAPGSKAPVLVVVFTCNHCPIAQMYEQRISQLAADYRARGVAVVAIQPNAPEAIRVDELDSSDLSDSLEEMRIRASYKHLDYPYLYDGETQQTARAYGPQATPHVFVFDRQRLLRYEGRMDDNYRIERVIAWRRYGSSTANR
jgi:thiol-disulfide isomerase/thioredoxin